MSGIRPSDCSKLAKKPKIDNDVIIFWHHVNVDLFWRYFVSLVKFRYWSKFHVNIIICSGIMTIFFYKGLTRKLETGSTPLWIFPSIWRLRWVMDTKFGTNVSNKCYWMLQNSRATVFTIFTVINGKKLGLVKLAFPHPD